MKNFVIGLLGIIAIGTLFLCFRYHNTLVAGNTGLGLCITSESKVAVGNQAPTMLLATSSSRQWAIIQQPIYASNTVTTSFSRGVTSGSGYLLAPATSSNYASERTLGYGTPIATNQPLYARTDTSSSTINVIECK